MSEEEWKHSIDLSDIFSDSTMGYEARRDEITRRIRMRWFYLGAKVFENEEGGLVELVNDMAAAETPDEFDDLWNRFYDWCDEHRVLVKVIPEG